jgi:hypothetical protein
MVTLIAVLTCWVVLAVIFGAVMTVAKSAR